MADLIDDATNRAETNRDEAVQRILANLPRQKSTGVCSACGDTIDSDRLKAAPWAKLCRDCAREAEDARKRLARVGA